MTEGDKPAYPSEFEGGEYDAFGAPVIAHRKYYGISKREYFAAMAMQGMLANSIDKMQGQQPWWSMNSDDMATEAVLQADHLIKALNKEK